MNPELKSPVRPEGSGLFPVTRTESPVASSAIAVHVATSTFGYFGDTFDISGHHSA